MVFGLGVGEIAGILATLKGLNEMLATIKETGANASSFSALISKYSNLDEQIRNVDSKAVEKPLTLEQSMKLQVAKRQADSFHQALKDSLLMQSGGASQYREIMQRIEDSREAHNRKMALLKKRKKERQKMMKEAMTYGTIALVCFIFIIGGIYVWVNYLR